MIINQLVDKIALKSVVDIFSNLADEKKVTEQMDLFTEDAEVITYMGDELFAHMHGRAEIEQVFSQFLANFHQVYHLNGQHTVTELTDNQAKAVHYCAVKLVQQTNDQKLLHSHSVRYQDEYQKIGGQWLISKRIANFVITETQAI